MENGSSRGTCFNASSVFRISLKIDFNAGAFSIPDAHGLCLLPMLLPHSAPDLLTNADFSTRLHSSWAHHFFYFYYYRYHYNHDYCVIVIVDVDVNIDVDIYVEICSKPRSSNGKQNSEKKCIRIKNKKEIWVSGNFFFSNSL